MVTLPPPRIIEHEGVSVVRDDLIPGGTKARYLARLFDEHDEVVYASPAYGGAQLALAYAARAAGKRATIFVAKRKDPHPRTLEARAAGARVFQVPHGYLSNVQAKAKAYAADHGAHLMAFGGASEAAYMLIGEAAGYVWNAAGPFDEVWCAAGSGVLVTGIRHGIEAHRGDAPEPRLVVVRVGAELHRFEGVADPPVILSAGVPFEREERQRPPFPSCPNYDAKAWAALMRARAEGRARGRILFWNVMGPSPTPHASPSEA